MRYGSVFSGIEAASVAWHPLGWQPVFYAEIDPFPCAVLKARHPTVPNWGDVTNYKDWPDAAIDVLVGGSPCQSFSVAGLRKGLADPRGNLALTFLGIADRYRPEWLIWENVPGVLSQDSGRAFGSIIGGMAELGYHVAYRVLDAQYVRVDGFGRAVPQRRRRVFVVGNLGDWRRAAAVLFEPESLSGNPAPRRKAREAIAGTIKYSLERCSADEAECGTLIPVAFGGNNTQGPIEAATAVRAKGGTGHGDFESETFIAFDTYNQAPTGDVAMTVCSRGDTEGGNGHLVPAIAFDCKASATRGIAARDNVSPTLRGMTEGDSHQNGGGQVAVAIPILEAGARTGRTGHEGHDGLGIGADGDPMFSLQASKQHAIAFDTTQITSPGNYSAPKDGDPCHPLASGAHPPAVAHAFKPSFYTRGKDGGLTGTSGEPNDVFPPLSADADKGDQDPLALIGHNSGWAVRRLTPRECERLQGFPDDYTLIPWRGKTAPDGPRYKALGNAMACNVMRWLGRRIDMVQAMSEALKEAAE